MIVKNLAKFSTLSFLLLMLNSCQLAEMIVPDLKEDDDNDEVPNLFDVDDDGDGLIEITRAEEFNAIRYVPDGSGYKHTPTDSTNRKGCGSRKGEKCIGYELTADIDLRQFDDWYPIGQKYVYGASLYPGIPFSAILDGNGHTIHSLRVTIRPFHREHQGIFGVLTGATIKNLKLDNIQVEANKAAGILAGAARFSHISHLFVSHSISSGKEATGGILGYGENIHIYASAVTKANLLARRGNNVGGLIGDAREGSIRASYATQNSIQGIDKVGGLVGNSMDLILSTSHSTRQKISAKGNMGGLVGYASGGSIQYSYAANTKIGKVLGNGLVGKGNNQLKVRSSYWDRDTSGANNNGFGTPKRTIELHSAASYADWFSGEALDVWCDKDDSREIEEKEQTDDNRIWDLSESTQYPSIRCAPGGVDTQHN